MAFVKVREGQTLGFNDGREVKTLKAGDIVEVPDHVADEVRDRAFLCTESGVPVEVASDLGLSEAEFERSAGHERIAMLENQLERAKKAVAQAEERLDGAGEGSARAAVLDQLERAQAVVSAAEERLMTEYERAEGAAAEREKELADRAKRNGPPGDLSPVGGRAPANPGVGVSVVGGPGGGPGEPPTE